MHRMGTSKDTRSVWHIKWLSQDKVPPFFVFFFTSVDRLCCPVMPALLPLQIYFWEFQRKNVTERLRTLFMPEAGVKLKNLTGYTNYMISVAAFNAAGDGPRSSPTRGRTQQAGKSKQTVKIWGCRSEWLIKLCVFSTSQRPFFVCFLPLMGRCAFIPISKHVRTVFLPL